MIGVLLLQLHHEAVKLNWDSKAGSWRCAAVPSTPDPSAVKAASSSSAVVAGDTIPNGASAKAQGIGAIGRIGGCGEISEPAENRRVPAAAQKFIGHRHAVGHRHIPCMMVPASVRFGDARCITKLRNGSAQRLLVTTTAQFGGMGKGSIRR